MRDILVTILVFSTIPAILKRPYIGVLVFAWLSYMNPHRLTWGFAYDMPFAAIIAGITILMLPFSKDRGRIPFSPLIVVWITWIAWMNVAEVFSFGKEAFGYEWNRAMKIQLMTFITILMLQSKEKIRYLVWVIVASIGFYSVKGGVFSILTGGKYLVWGPPGTYFEGNNGLAITVLMMLPLMYFLRNQVNNVWGKRALAGAMILSVISVLSSYSRGAFLALVAVGLYFLFKSRRRAVLVPVIIGVIAVGVMLMPDQYFDRLATIQTYQEDASAMGRINAWYFAYNFALEHPFTGGGFEVFQRELFAIYAPDPDNYHGPHSIYFEVLGKQGFAGLVLFILLGWLSLREAKRLRKLTRDNQELKWANDLASMIHVSLIAYAVGGMFLGLAYFDLYYHFIALLVLTRIEAAKTLASKDKELHSVTQSENICESKKYIKEKEIITRTQSIDGSSRNI